MPLVSVHRRGQQDEVCMLDTFARIRHVSINGADLNRCFEVLDPAPDADDRIRQLLAAQDHPQRAADEPDSDNGHLFEMWCRH